jgi:hypothetical protein
VEVAADVDGDEIGEGDGDDWEILDDVVGVVMVPSSDEGVLGEADGGELGEADSDREDRLLPAARTDTAAENADPRKPSVCPSGLLTSMVIPSRISW